MKKLIPIIPSIFFLILFLIFFYLLKSDRNPSEIPSAMLNKKAPNFNSKSLFTRNKVASSEILGNEITLVNFFATWCKPCLDEHIYIKRFKNETKVKIIGINYKDSSEKTIKWLYELGNPYSVVITDKNGKIGIDWGVYGIPETFIINTKGIIKFRHVGPITDKSFRKINLIINEIKE